MIMLHLPFSRGTFLFRGLLRWTITCFFIVGLSIPPPAALAQLPRTRVDPSSPNLRYIEHLVKESIDSIRISHGLHLLADDPILYEASLGHAKFLADNGKLSHYQGLGRRHRSYHDRVMSLEGAEGLHVAENLSQSSIQQTINGSESFFSFAQLASRLVNQWLYSHGSMANILTPSHAIVGVGAAYCSNEMTVTVVAKFSTVPYTYTVTQNLDLFPYQPIPPTALNRPDRPVSEYQWGIKPDPHRRVVNDLAQIRRLTNTLDLELRGDSVFVVFSNARRIDQLFENRDDGVTIEVVPASYFSCRNSSKVPQRVNGEFTIKGELLAPKYRDYLLNNHNSQNSRSRVVHRFIGVIPSHLRESNPIINLVVLKRNSIVDIITHRELPSYSGTLSLALHPLPDIMNLPQNYQPNPRLDTLSLRIYFEQNSAVVPQIIGDSIARWSASRQIEKVAVFSYASVEGTLPINKDLFQRRAEEVILFIRSEDEEFRMIKHSGENWMRFVREVEESDFSFLAEQDTASIRHYVNIKEHSAALEPILSKHRYTDFTILGRRVPNDHQIDTLALQDYMDLYSRVMQECRRQPAPCRVRPEVMQQMQAIQLFLLNRHLQGKMEWSIPANLPIAIMDKPFDIANEPLTQLYFNKIRFKLSYMEHTLNLADRANLLNTLTSFPSPPSTILYNSIATQVQLTDKEPLAAIKNSDIQALISRLERTIDNAEALQRIELLQHIDAVEQAYRTDGGYDSDAAIFQSLDFISSYYINYPDNPTRMIEVAWLLAAFGQVDQAMDLIEPYAMSSNPPKDALIIYLKCYYNNQRVKQNTDFYQLLKDAGDTLTPEEWCDLFNDDWPISLQTLDHNPIRVMFCRMCE